MLTPLPACPRLPSPAADWVRLPLQLLDLSFNQLSGAVPLLAWSSTGLGPLSATLGTLLLAGNALSGPLEQMLGFQALACWSVAGNPQLCGAVPVTAVCGNTTNTLLGEAAAGSSLLGAVASCMPPHHQCACCAICLPAAPGLDCMTLTPLASNSSCVPASVQCVTLQQRSALPAPAPAPIGAVSCSCQLCQLCCVWQRASMAAGLLLCLSLALLSLHALVVSLPAGRGGAACTQDFSLRAGLLAGRPPLCHLRHLVTRPAALLGSILQGLHAGARVMRRLPAGTQRQHLQLAIPRVQRQHARQQDCAG